MTLNRPFTRLGMRRRYESWFLRFGLADGSGAWWFRYLLTNPGRGGCPTTNAAPVQVWATWFPRNESPQTLLQGFAVDGLTLTRGPFCLDVAHNRIEESSCCGSLEQGRIEWDLRYSSQFTATLSNKGWIGFSRTPHSDAVFSGKIRLGDRIFRGDPLGIGLQGHNCGFRHRNFWTWMHACFPQPDGSISTLEALTYEMPLGLVFRKAILWHRGRAVHFRGLRESRRDRSALGWCFAADSSSGWVQAELDGSGTSLHRLDYMKTDCSATFEVANNSRAQARVRIDLRDSGPEEFSTTDNAVLEMAG